VHDMHAMQNVVVVCERAASELPRCGDRCVLFGGRCDGDLPM
jgi:hypothetical protein